MTYGARSRADTRSTWRKTLRSGVKTSAATTPAAQAKAVVALRVVSASEPISSPRPTDLSVAVLSATAVWITPSGIEATSTTARRAARAP